MKKYKITPIKFISEDDTKCLFPLPVRCLILGKSGSGKTTLLWNIITKYWIPYENLYIFTKSLEQPIYEKLQEIFVDIEDIDTNFYDNCDDIMSVDECRPNSLIIFDDCVLEKQNKIKEYFVRSRPKNISCIYISQCYSLVDLQVIRTNLNFLIMFKQSDHYIKKVWEDLLGSDLTLEKLKEYCNVCWKKEFGFCSIDLQRRRYMNQLSVTDV